MENEETTAQVGTPGAPRWLVRLRHRLMPRWAGNGREAFQRRFLVSACLLAAAVTTLSLIVSISQGARLEAAVLAAFQGALALLLAAIRFGVRPRLVAWSALAAVGTFLVAMSLMTSALHAVQFKWFLLLPLSAMVLVGPRADDPAGELKGWPVALAMLLTLAAVVLVVLAHEAGLTFDQPAAAPGPWAAVLDFALFLASVLGLASIYGLSARETHAELQRLRELLSVCAWCGKIDDDGSWIPLEQYLVRRHRSDLSHGICPSCYARQDSAGGERG